MLQGKDAKERFTRFLKAMFQDVAGKNGNKKSFYEYFDPDFRNIKMFKDNFIPQNLGTIEQVYPDDPLAEVKLMGLTHTIFAKMSKDFHDGYYHLYLPKKDGEDYYFRGEQETILARLVDQLMLEEAAKETEIEQYFTNTQGATSLEMSRSKAEKEIQNIVSKLQKAGFKIEGGAEGLKFDEASGLIKGKVKNAHGELLNVKIDAENPEYMAFSDEEGEAAFVIKDNPANLKMAFEMEKGQMMDLGGYTRGNKGIPKKKEENLQQAQEAEGMEGMKEAAAMGAGIASLASPTSPSSPIPTETATPTIKGQISIPTKLSVTQETEGRDQSPIPEKLRIKLPKINSRLEAGLQGGSAPDPTGQTTQEQTTTTKPNRVTEEQLRHQKYEKARQEEHRQHEEQQAKRQEQGKKRIQAQKQQEEKKKMGAGKKAGLFTGGVIGTVLTSAGVTAILNNII
ncbi:hypothetical protein HOE67_03795 [Candidatus Peregrinibacteria bacterium]|jgi:hypothetical protein|nr:hypothetical protein [Candidatus Peregrinibacteria bacterium]MBT4056209.1 hypothetical protein [Candidatus Peregrinibacteria bacterium]